MTLESPLKVWIVIATVPTNKHDSYRDEDTKPSDHTQPDLISYSPGLQLHTAPATLGHTLFFLT